MLLEWHGLSLPAARLRAAIAGVLRDGPHTPDLGGTAKTSDVAESVLARL
jgi:isocitrate/isopropylmalate dehydrogenase